MYFFQLQLQFRYQSDLERGKPSMLKPPFACMRLCNPWIEDPDGRGFIAPSPGKKLQKCAPKQIQVNRSKDTKVDVGDGKEVDKVIEAQILLNSANDKRTIGEQWNEYHVAGKTMDQYQLGLNNDDLTVPVATLKDEYAKCEEWLPGNFQITRQVVL